MTELQKIQLDILKNFIEVCEKLELKYYMVCGSALGAAKYNGFIPWDDDMDVAMPREDYEVFLEKAQELLPKELFIQTYRTDPYYPQIYCKLRNSNTTFIEKSASELLINHGIFIDVFPLDGYPKSNRKAKLLEIRKRIYQSMLLSVYQVERSGKSKVLFEIYKLLRISDKTAKIARKYEKMISKNKLNDSELWCNHGNWQGKLEYAPREQYGEGIWACFEKIKVRIPEKYDEYLTQKYGDWRADLPKEQQVGHHYYTICDVDIPYIKYVEK